MALKTLCGRLEIVELFAPLKTWALADLLARSLRSDINDQGTLTQLAYEFGSGSRIAEGRTLTPLVQRVLVAS